jgi:hypothetical protein
MKVLAVCGRRSVGMSPFRRETAYETYRTELGSFSTIETGKPDDGTSLSVERIADSSESDSRSNEICGTPAMVEIVPSVILSYSRSDLSSLGMRGAEFGSLATPLVDTKQIASEYTKHQAPSTKHQAPSTKHQAPSTKHQAPSTKNQEPRTKNQEPRTKNQEPRTKN